MSENGLGLNRPRSDLDGMEDDVMWAEQYAKSDTGPDEEDDDMYDDK